MNADPNLAPTVAARLLFFVGDILKAHGVDPRDITRDLPSFAGRDMPPEWISWNDYIEVIERLGTIAGGIESIAQAMREAIKTSYSELRALAGFFPGPMPFFTFLNTQLMPQLQPGCRAEMTVHSETHCSIRYRLQPGYRGSKLYFDATIVLTEIFPCHFDLPEAKVTIASLTDRELVCEAVLPKAAPSVDWGSHLPSALVGASVKEDELKDGTTKGDTSPNGTIQKNTAKKDTAKAHTTKVDTTNQDKRQLLSAREQQVLELVCLGMTNAEIGKTLGTSASTVKNQISAVLEKMDAANRTELATMAAQPK